MKKYMIRGVAVGGRCRYSDVPYIKLDETPGGDSLILAEKASIESVPFRKVRGDLPANYFPGSGVLLRLQVELYEDDPNYEADLVSMPIDMTAMDGIKNYGVEITRVRILTYGEYRRYRKHISLLPTPWWTATPWCTESSPDGQDDLVCVIDKAGRPCPREMNAQGIAARLALWLKAETVVTVEDGTGEDVC